MSFSSLNRTLALNEYQMKMNGKWNALLRAEYWCVLYVNDCIMRPLQTTLSFYLIKHTQKKGATRFILQIKSIDHGCKLPDSFFTPTAQPNLCIIYLLFKKKRDQLVTLKIGNKKSNYHNSLACIVKKPKMRNFHCIFQLKLCTIDRMFSTWIIYESIDHTNLYTYQF